VVVLEVLHRTLRAVRVYGRLRSTLRAGLSALILGLSVTFLLRLFSGTAGWEVLWVAALGTMGGALRPMRPERLYLWAGRQLGVGEGLLAAWELSRRGEKILLRRLWESIASGLVSPRRLLVPRGIDYALLSAALLLFLAISLGPPLDSAHFSVSPTPPSPVAFKGEEAPERGEVKKVKEMPLVPPEWEGEEPLGVKPEPQYPPTEVPSEASGSVPPSRAEPAPGKGGEPVSSSPEVLPSETQQGVEPLPEEKPKPSAAMVPSPEEGASAVLREAEGEGEEAEGSGNSFILRPTEETELPSQGELTESTPLPQLQKGPQEGTKELGGKAEGEPPTPGEGEFARGAEPARKTQAAMRPGEGPERTGTALSVPPEPPGGGGTPFIPPVESAEFYVGARELPPGAEELVRRYFAILSQEGER